MIFAQAGYAKTLGASCVMVKAVSVEERTTLAPVDCHQCCAAMPCCLTSKPPSEAPSRPEPLSNERSHQIDHAPGRGDIDARTYLRLF